MPVAPPNLTQLTSRLIADPRIGHHFGPPPTYELAGWVKDELLVSEDVPKAVRAQLGKLGWGPASSVLAPGAGGKMPKRESSVVDIEIWKPAGPHKIVEVVLTNLMSVFGKLPKVSPNHLLVPCNHGSYCPAGPPRRVAAQPQLAQKIAHFAPGRDTIRVVVIDTGYIRHPALEARAAAGGFTHVQGQVMNNRAWVPSQPDALYKVPGGAADLLDGHGTFTAGVIAARCRRANITLVGIRAVESAATESAVARAIYRHAKADLIVPVFAFHSLMGIGNWTFQNVLPQLAPGSLVVCPAGNESSSAAHFPAALRFPDFPVIGVGSFRPTASANLNLSDFSDFGNWVFGYAGGEDVVGPYLNRRFTVEDGPPTPISFNGWSKWSGTSFATPKVAAALANATPSPGLAREAALAMQTAAQSAVLSSAVAGALTGLDLRPLAP